MRSDKWQAGLLMLVVGLVFGAIITGGLYQEDIARETRIHVREIELLKAYGEGATAGGDAVNPYSDMDTGRMMEWRKGWEAVNGGSTQ